MKIAALFLLLTSCGGFTLSNEVVVEYGDSERFLALTHTGQAPTRIVVNSALEWSVFTDMDFVMAHELIHAAGFSEHRDDASCFSNTRITDHTQDGPCPDELADMASVSTTFTIRVLDAGLYEPTRWAADMWNAAVGREMFRISE